MVDSVIVAFAAFIFAATLWLGVATAPPQQAERHFRKRNDITRRGRPVAATPGRQGIKRALQLHAQPVYARPYGRADDSTGLQARPHQIDRLTVDGQKLFSHPAARLIETPRQMHASHAKIDRRRRDRRDHSSSIQAPYFACVAVPQFRRVRPLAVGGPAQPTQLSVAS